MSKLPGTIPAAKERTRPYVPRTAPRPVAQHHSKSQEEEETPPTFLEICWPIVGGLILGFLTPRLLGLVSAQDPWAMWIVYPFAVLAGRPEMGFSDELTRSLPQLLVYIQFPLEGLYATLTMRRNMAFTAAMAQLFFVHFVAAFVFWLLSRPGATHGM